MKVNAVRYDELVDLEKKYENEKRCGYDEEPCAICGRPIKEGSKCENIRMFGGGEYFTTSNVEDYKLPDDMGWYSVGLTCFKKYKKLEKEIEVEEE